MCDAIELSADDPHVTLRYDRVPKGEVEIRRASPVISSDGHQLGHVDGFLVDGDEHIAHLALEHGHLWGKREVGVMLVAVGSALIAGALSRIATPRSAEHRYTGRWSPAEDAGQRAVHLNRSDALRATNQPGGAPPQPDEAADTDHRG